MNFPEYTKMLINDYDNKKRTASASRNSDKSKSNIIQQVEKCIPLSGGVRRPAIKWADNLEEIKVFKKNPTEKRIQQI
jgi:hypothetical protein